MTTYPALAGIADELEKRKRKAALGAPETRIGTSYDEMPLPQPAPASERIDVSEGKLPPNPNVLRVPSTSIVDVPAAPAGELSAATLGRLAVPGDTLMIPGPQQAQYARMAEGPDKARGGFVGHLLGALKGFAYGGIGGAAVGGISPQKIKDFEWRVRELPQAYQRARAERQQQDEQLEAAVRIGQQTGISPLTGGPTEQARERMAQMEATRAYREQNAIYREQGLSERQQAIENRQQEFREAAAKNHVQYATMTGQPIDPEVVKGTTMAPFAGKVLNKAAPEMSPYQRESLDIRKQELTAKGAAEARAASREDRNATHQQATETAARMKEARQDLQKFSQLQAKAKQANDLATAVHNGLGALPKDTPPEKRAVRIKGQWYTPDDEERLWNDRDTASQEMKQHAEYMRDTHGGLVTVSDAGDYAEINKEAAKQATAKPSGAPPKYPALHRGAKVGQIYTHNGRAVKVTAVDANGVQVEPVQ